MKFLPLPVQPCILKTRGLLGDGFLNKFAWYITRNLIHFCFETILRKGWFYTITLTKKWCRWWFFQLTSTSVVVGLCCLFVHMLQCLLQALISQVVWVGTVHGPWQHICHLSVHMLQCLLWALISQVVWKYRAWPLTARTTKSWAMCWPTRCSDSKFCSLNENTLYGIQQWLG